MGLRQSFSPVMRSRGGDVADEGAGGAFVVVLGVFPGPFLEPAPADAVADVCGADPTVPVDDGVLGDACAESVCASDEPAGEYAAAAASGDVELIFVDVAAFGYSVAAAHEVVIVVAGIGLIDEVAEFMAVSSTAARVRVEDDVALCDEPLKFEGEGHAVHAVRAAVDVENHGIFFIGVEVGWFHDPTLEIGRAHV